MVTGKESKMKRGFKIIILCHGKGQGLFQRVGYCMMVLADNLSLFLIALSLNAPMRNRNSIFYCRRAGVRIIE